MKVDVSKSLEQLEHDVWQEPSDSSYLVTTCHRLRKKALQDLTIEDLRILISQNIGLEYLNPIAINILEENILAEGDLYPGDLFQSVLESDEGYWKQNKALRGKVKQLYAKNASLFEFDNLYRQIRSSYNRFQ